MEKLDNLKLIKKKMDTSMAQEFIKNDMDTNCWPELGQTSSLILPHEPKKNGLTFMEGIRVGKRLAKKVEENAEMFAQLEYLARGTDSRDVMDGHVKLMSQFIRCSNALWNDHPLSDIIVTESTPLFQLASVASCLYSSTNFPKICVASQNMKHLCRFFVNLCHDVGLYVQMFYGNDLSTEKNADPHGNGGCTGVITEVCDLDSAMDAFIQSSKTAPWRLTKIYVQESVFKDFKDGLTARARQPEGSSVITVGDKTLLLECLNPAPALGIPVAAYRTTKELLSLLSTSTPYLSLWAANSALSNEVALSAVAHTVWINDHAAFDGPPRGAISIVNTSRALNICTDVGFESLIKPWEKMLEHQRLELVISAVEASELDSVAMLLPELTLKWRSSELLHVTDGAVCIGVQQPMGTLYKCYVVNNKEDLLNVIKALVNGNSIITDYADEFIPFVKELTKAGVPIKSRKDTGTREIDTKIKVLVPKIFEKLKVIRSNHGTIFAN